MRTYLTKASIASTFAVLFIGGTYLFLHKGFFRKLFYTAGTVDKVFLDASHMAYSEITLYKEGTFARKDDHYLSHYFYSGTFKVNEENIRLYYDGDNVPPNEFTTGILYPPTLSLYSVSEENGGDTTARVYTQLTGF